LLSFSIIVHFSDNLSKRTTEDEGETDSLLSPTGSEYQPALSSISGSKIVDVEPVEAFKNEIKPQDRVLKFSSHYNEYRTAISYRLSQVSH
jgi:hypothetical protein